MKTRILQKTMVFTAIIGLMALASTAVAQDAAATVATPAAMNAAPQLPPGAPQIVQLAQAKVSDSTIVAYVENSGKSYHLDADQIIYLKRHGVSDAVITTMLNQPKTTEVAATAAVPTPATPAPQPDASVETSTATVAPTVTYVQTVPTTSYYYDYAQPDYYYPAYYYGGWYPGVSVSLGWGGHWGGGFHGGYHHGGGFHGGWHGGGGFHGGWHGGGGFHGHH